MGFCFVFGCSHRNTRDKCSFYRFPKDPTHWEKLCRRKDRRINVTDDRICSCHFRDGIKENGPTLFPWNEGKVFNFSDPPTTRKLQPVSRQAKKRAVEPEELVFAPETADHLYAYSCPAAVCTDRLSTLLVAKDTLQAEVTRLEEELAGVQLELQKKKPMSIQDICHDTDKMLLYTSLPFDIFFILVRSLQRFDLVYFYGWKVQSISLEDQLLITLIKLKLNLRDLDIAERFCTSRATISNILKTFICSLHELLFVGILKHKIPSQVKCKGSMPRSFGEFSGARLVMDCTEITQDIPYDLNRQAACYSNYKSRHTVKALTCVAPNATIVYCSDLYPGSTSDVAIVEHCGVLHSLSAGDLILADKGFTIHKLLPSGVNVNIPPFLIGKSKFTPQEAQLCGKIAKARIHVERANERIKNFEILNHIPANLRSFSTKIMQLCCSLVDLQAPLLAEVAKDYM